MKDNVNFQNKYPKGFMTEDLTPLRQHLAFKLRKDDKIKTSWSIDGRLKYIKKVGDGKPETIDSPYDLSKLGYSKEAIETIINQSLFKKQKQGNNNS